MTFDYIVIGAGSAGSALVNRLSASGRNSVLVLEAGPNDNRFYVRVPLGYGKVYYDKNVNWRYQTEPVSGLNNNISYWPRGKVLGGSSSINAMVYVRGHESDFAQWAEVASGWSWSNVEPIFRRMENYDGPASTQRGIGGPLSVHDMSADAHPLCQTYLKAAAQCQIPTNDDYNAGDMEGAALYQINTQNGFRASSSVCYLHPARMRANVSVVTNAQVTRILFDGKMATGVEYIQGERIQRAKARCEIVLAAGAINSPQLLQLSGIGPSALLKQHEIEVVEHSAHVGMHLQDHLGADIVCRTNVDSLNQALGPWLGKFKAGMQFLLQRRGPLSLSLNQAGGFIRSNATASGPDLQLYFSPVSYTRAPANTRPLISPDPFPGFLIGYNPCKPTSRGYLKIRSSDPFTPPLMQPNYLNTDYDRAMMLSGMRLTRKLLEAPAFKQVVEDEVYPGRDCQSDEDMMTFLRDNAWTVFHQCGTCRMGDNASESVIDSRLRVHGVSGLRIADASVFPSIPTGNTNAPSIMVGERAADFILQDNPD